ncbi:hypothetical protein DMH03_28600 [Amycolatopsis sp. WAC 01376]|uniref:esterase/lipase family protein n=1 Tax=Amycolatopsis sp. WAC 01376 TaxID=2203195 RepID=UPI000F771A2F|nr:hypothetical protein [Amycolatopsis sp. WAC 01376]RSM57205.1 hypothetical protein DMH03_28600 [Amycolatopsis sp. WAC 01376]
MGLKHLLVIVPGIGGSVLEYPDGRPLWGQNLQRTGRSVFAPAGLTMSEPVVPVGLLPSMRVLPWKKVAGYDRLVQRLMNKFRLEPDDIDTVHPCRAPRPAASVLLFPYDFRQGMVYNAERLEAEIARRVGDRQVIVVAHSMGGVVARWWWAVLGGHRICRSLITVATPHRGAPKAIDWLLNGVRLGPASVAAMSSRLLKDAAEVVSGWDSTWELLPRYPAVLDASGPAYPHEVSVAPESFRIRAKVAYERHLELEAVCRDLFESTPEAKSRFMAFYATGHVTAGRAVIEGQRLRVSRADAEWLPSQGWEGGDGTVPAISATPVEYSADGDDGVYHRAWWPEPHLPIASASGVVEFVARFEAAPLDAVRGEQGPDRPWVGFDVDDVTAAGVPSTASVRLCGADPQQVKARARLIAEPGASAEVPDSLPVEWDGGSWRVEIPALPAGAHRLRVELDHVPEVDRVVGEDIIGVIEP